MKDDTSRSGERSAAGMLTLTNMDEMTLRELLDYFRWWTTQPSADHRALIAPKNDTRH
jgi:hypothetical protein